MGRQPKYLTEEERIEARRKYQETYQRRRRASQKCKRQSTMTYEEFNIHVTVHCLWCKEIGLDYKEAARGCIYRAVKFGFLIKPDKCEYCGASGTVHAHHPDYNAPLDVIWLCPKCHMLEHPERKDAHINAKRSTVKYIEKQLSIIEMELSWLNPDKVPWHKQKIEDLEKEKEHLEYELNNCKGILAMAEERRAKLNKLKGESE